MPPRSARARGQRSSWIGPGRSSLRRRRDTSPLSERSLSATTRAGRLFSDPCETRTETICCCGVETKRAGTRSGPQEQRAQRKDGGGSCWFSEVNRESQARSDATHGLSLGFVTDKVGKVREKIEKHVSYCIFIYLCLRLLSWSGETLRILPVTARSVENTRTILCM